VLFQRQQETGGWSSENALEYRKEKALGWSAKLDVNG
jgi:hypothetical protein